MAEQSKKTAEFVGEPGPGSQINLNLPQPGQHVGRRILKIEDIPASHFLGHASTFGTLWPKYLGIEKIDDVWQIRDVEKYTSQWLTRYSRVNAVDAGVESRVRTALNLSARSQLSTSGSLVSWARGNALTKGGERGRGALARLSSSPDDSGNTDPLPSDLPEATLPEEDPPIDDFFGSMVQLENGVVDVSVQTWGGNPATTPVDVEEEPQPALFIIQVVGISSFLGKYGLGRTVKTTTLLPGENYSFRSRTWRSSEETMTNATSIIDSYDEKSSERFAETVMNETTDTATREKTENWHVEAGAKASIGIASANVSGGGAGEYSSGTEEFSKSLEEAIREHAAESTSHRENTVTSSSESTVSTEDEEVVERTIKNINVSRVLNFRFMEMNQEWRTKTHLKDIRIGFSNGNAESWREESVSGLRRLVEEFVKSEHVDRVCSDILATIAVVRNANDAPVGVLEQILLNQCGTDYQVREAQPDDECQYPAPTKDGQMYYRFKRGYLGQVPDEKFPVDGVLLSDRTLILGSDSLLVEPLLGESHALDLYSTKLQLETIRAQRLANDKEALAIKLISDGSKAQVELYRSVFGVCCADDEEPPDA